MTQNLRIVEGRQFRTEAEYNKAMKDKQLLETIHNKYNFNNLKQLEELLKQLQSGKIIFYTLLGQDLQDEVEDKIDKLKKQNQDKSSNRKKNRKTKEKIQAIDSDILDAYVKEELKKQEKRRKLVVWLCCFIAVGCLGYFFVYTYFDYKTKQSYQQLSELKEKSMNGKTGNHSTGVNYDTGQEIPEVLDDYKSLLNKNKKLIGWVKIDDTNIDYPVMQTNNNEYYLDHNLNQEYDKNGSIFMDKDCDVLKPSTNFILYGHHMKGGQMFGKLDLYSSEDYYKEHKYIQFDTIYEKGIYEVMYVFRSKIFSEEDIVFKYYQFIDALSEQEFDSYMSDMSEMSIYDTGVTAKYGDQLLTLSTCDYYVNDGRFVVVAKKIE